MAKNEPRTTDDEQPPAEVAATQETPAAEPQAVAPREDPEFVVAKETLFVNGDPSRRAHNAGELVPRVNVDKNGWGDLVES